MLYGTDNISHNTLWYFSRSVLMRKIFREIHLVPQNIVMDLNNVIHNYDLTKISIYK